MIIYRQSIFARRDYEGLTQEGIERLKEERGAQAKLLLRKRKNLNEGLAEDLSMSNKQKKIAVDNLKKNGKTVNNFDSYAIGERNRKFDKLLNESKSEMDSVKKSMMEKNGSKYFLNPKNPPVPVISQSTVTPPKKELGFIGKVARWAKKNPAVAAGAVAGGLTLGAGATYLATRKKEK